TAGSLIGSGCASSVIDNVSSRSSRARIARRIGSASAANVLPIPGDGRIAILVQRNPETTALLPPGADGRSIRRLAAEKTLDRRDLPILQLQEFRVPKRFTVFGQAVVHHERRVSVSEQLKQIETFDVIDLTVPAPRLEFTFADVVVAIRTREREVVRQHHIEWLPISRFPRFVIFTNGAFVVDAELRRSHHAATL
ncbi:MAG TPA: hypothetical protein VH082_11880, partial [Rudaea sp.]|nr:hypothetical protein [Rudaea sp.]